jgi:hypothetical protein
MLARRSLLIQRKPLERRSRLRAKPRRGAVGDAARFQASLRGLPCQCGCGRWGECTHHILADAPGKKARRDEWFVVRLSHHCHNRGNVSVHLLGSEAAFQRETGVDLVAAAISNKAQWEKANAPSSHQ